MVRADYELCYRPGLPGRGECIRLSLKADAVRLLGETHRRPGAWLERVATLPAIAAYVGTGCCRPFGDGPFRHDPERDVA